MSWIEKKFISQLAFRLRNFKRKSDSLYNFSCHVCGDSSAKKTKARGYLFERGGSFYYHCHNCSVSKNFSNFLKSVDEDLYAEYTVERLAERGKRPILPPAERDARTTTKFSADPVKRLKSVAHLPDDDPCRALVLRRKIPTAFHDRLYSCPNFCRFTNEVVPGKFSSASLFYDETRLLIPFYENKEDRLPHAYQGRSLSSTAQSKYITIVVDDSVPKVFGLDRVDREKTVWVLEGPIDAMFVPNAVAVAGGDLSSAAKYLPRDKLVMVFDNEPRSTQTVQKMERAARQGRRVVVWPQWLTPKDVNDMFLFGISESRILDVLEQSTHEGLAALAAIVEWKCVRT